jgi:Bacterial membrane protein YfhO
LTECRRELLAFCACLAVCVSAFFHESLFLGKVLSPADVLFVSASFRGEAASDYEPANRLLMDPVLQFQPWLEFNRRMIRSGRLPLWNGSAGCGAPHLANGQSAVFDPFNLLAYVWTVPTALGWMAACRLWVAGLGMFLLARQWGLGRWGRWFVGLAYPVSGFMVVWLLYPVTAVAVWMPWLFLATEGLFRKPTARAAGWLGIVVALVVLGGHIQTSAHVLLAGGLYALARLFWPAEKSAGRARAPMCWALGVCLGLGLASVQVLPLAAYLAKSAVWSARKLERKAWWKIERPRLLEMVCTVVPYAYGSQRRGHPNLARALGVNNLNESAGGFAGLGTILWLAPLAVLTRWRTFRVAFLAALAISGALGAFRLPPVDNLLRALPVLEVTDNRRLTLWVSFALVLLGGIGLDGLADSRRLARWWIVSWAFGAVLLLALACGIGPLEGRLKERALAHYRERAAATAAADDLAYEERALRQVARALEFLPRYYGLIAFELAALAALALTLRRSPGSTAWARPVVMGLVLVDLAGLGWGLNPAIGAAVHSYEPPLVARLRKEMRTGGRALGIGEELPPNVLMRFGLCDIRNYDSVELARSLRWFAPLYGEPQGGISSRSEVTWQRVAANQDVLRESGAFAVVAAAPPPEGPFARVEKIGRVWVLWLDGLPWARARSPSSRLTVQREDGWARIRIESNQAEGLVVSETYDPGWTALIDGKAAEICQNSGVFLQIEVPSGDHHVIIKYDPTELKCGLAVSLLSCIFLILVLTGIRMFWIPGITTRGGLDGAEPAG